MKNPRHFDKVSAEAKKAELKEVTERLEKGVREVFTSESYRKYLDFCSRLPRYSVNNQILIWMQRPNATMCQSYTAWQKAGRQVKKGEKGIRIFAPAPYKVKQEQDVYDSFGRPVFDLDGTRMTETVETTIPSFKLVSTFDVSQTEGEDLPSIGVDELMDEVDGYRELLEAIIGSIPVPVTFAETIESGAKGYYHLEENKIVVLAGMSEAQTIKTLLHEATHQALHSRDAERQQGFDDKKSRGRKEVEAESVAYVVCQHFGVNTSDYSFGYVAAWSEGREVVELKASLDLIRSTAASLIEKIEGWLCKDKPEKVGAASA